MVSEQRQWDRLMAMARLGAIPGDGVNRACLTELDREARRLLIAWAKRDRRHGVGRSPRPICGCAARAPIAQRRAGGDRQPHGHPAERRPLRRHLRRDRRPGGAHRAARRRRDHTPPDRGGGLDQRGRRAVRARLHGQHGVERLHAASRISPTSTDPDGVRFGDALAAHLAAEADVPRRPLGGKPHAYVEAHIEQGPRLEAEGLDIGVVTGIQGSRWFTVTLTGETAHAGTTPLALRRDAVQDMVRAITALNALMHDPRDVLRFTVGRIVVEPNTSNSVANRVELHHRFPPSRQGRAAGARRRDCRRRAGGGARCRRDGAGDVSRAAGRIFAAGDRCGGARRHGARAASRMRLPSGAFHDAQFVVPVCPTGMIFVPCRKGISHNPAEYSTPAQVGRRNARADADAA